MKAKFAAGIVAGFALIATAFALEIGKPAPDFSGKTAQEKVISLASLKEAKKPFVLYFISTECPINAQATPYFTQIFNAYGGKFPIVGIAADTKSGIEPWQAKFKVPYPVILDPQLEIMSKYGVVSSPTLVLIDEKGNVGKVWTGYSKQSLTELSETMARTLKVKAAKLDFSKAPAKTRFGCAVEKVAE